MLAIALALGSSLAYGLSDFLGGLKSRSMPVLSVLLVSQCTALVLLAALVVPISGVPHDGSLLVYAAIAGLSEAVGVTALYRGLAIGTMSIVAPVAATAPAVPVLIGLALGEVPSPPQGVGITLAAVGIVITAREDPIRLGRRVALGSAAFGILTALGFGGFYAAMDAASEGDIPWALLVARLTAVVLFLGTALVARRPVGLERSELPVVASIGVLIIVADSLYATASTHGLLSVVAVLSSLYALVTIALARALLHERIQAHQRIGIAMCLGGVIAIAAG